ncbi:hypothetical protein N9D23_14960, partial [Rubripirellula sp.]|nr:hypothetical protein [Rubripirellula sp.]
MKIRACQGGCSCGDFYKPERSGSKVQPSYADRTRSLMTCSKRLKDAYLRQMEFINADIPRKR